MAKVLLISDIMQHDKQHDIEKLNNYNFVLSDEIIDIMKGNDLVVGNFETTIGAEYSGYPKFSVHKDFLKILNNIDVFCLANNHINDFGKKGIIETKNAITNFGKRYVGVDGLYTLPYTDLKGNKYLIQSFTRISNEPDYEDMICKEFQKVELGDRIGILYSHEGIEYSKSETRLQKQTKRLALDYGYSACVMIHSHVIGKQELIDGKMFSTNGLGNFISHQKSLDEQLGRMVQLDICGETKIIKSIVFYDTQTIVTNNKQRVELIGYRVM